MVAERIEMCTYEGFTYSCRVVENAEARTEPIVLVGGAYQDMYAFHRVERPWRRAATLVVVELPGVGTADVLPASYGFDFLGLALGHLLDRLGLERVNLVGVSYGCAVAYRHARTNPTGVARLGLCGYSPSLRAESVALLRAMADALESDEPDEFAHHAARFLVRQDPAVFVTNRDAVLRVLAYVLGGTAPEQRPRFADASLRMIRHALIPPGPVTGVRALCFTGEHDQLCPPDRGREVAARFDDASFALLRDADHLCFLERPADFADLVTRFCTDQPLDDLPYLTPVERHGRRWAADREVRS
ncbi:alpha/beta fold hydrolase [Saccharothrix syringae]|uniref:Alpha/beta fold hydrolase n=1 Tax=Saccharothrix syringae TaxID=103733 RepID=A0A5Q0H2I1_SACSY|nr:alpha/beta hydrolase [Saccharothrix syringae]QFZ20323.1 alpha/beta fold hydrolase [Saccharothrix syringae]